MSSLQKQLIKNKLPPLYPGSLGGARLGGVNRRRDYTPVSWDKYFDSYKDVVVNEQNTFRVYLKGTVGPLLVFLHGGGYSGLTWSLLSASISSFVECRIAALDFRGHGETHCTDDDNLSADTLSNDVGEVLTSLFPDDEDSPPMILVGHSMGGAIAVHTVYKDLIPAVIALVVIDVVEGTALNALQSMQSFLRSRPPSFESLPTAIEWCIRSGQVRNVESAKVSMPGQLKNAVSNQCATSEVNFETDKEALSCQVVAHRHVAPTDSIPEEVEEAEEEKISCHPDESLDNKKTQFNDTLCDGNVFKQPQTPARSVKYVWRIDLSKTEKFWTGWFEGLSNMFLATSVPKLLLLAGVDRLDRDLTIGQMQGKFQMRVLPQCGHAVHEDDPDKVAEAIATFLVRNKFATALCEF